MHHDIPRPLGAGWLIYEKKLIPKKIGKGSHIRVIASARSLGLLSPDSKGFALQQLEAHGFKVSFGKNVDEIDEFNSSSIASRIEDLHDAFRDKDVDAILTVIGGYNTNQLLRYIDYDLIAANPKIFCGFSDITAIGNAITAKTGLVTYCGTHFSSWGMKKGFEYSVEYFEKALTTDEPFALLSSKDWSDDPWYIDQEKRYFIENEGYWVMNSGEANGRTVGGHVRCLGVLQGTEYWPSLENTILLLEEDYETNPPLFDRMLQSLVHQPDFLGVKGILIGHFQKESKMTKELLSKIIKEKKELSSLPIIANVNFGHTTPIATLPVGGSIQMRASDSGAKIIIIEH
jgi:muramoyltetrapeptide carboxypeptidase LdcA involved in peptidoglycan recycling